MTLKDALSNWQPTDIACWRVAAALGIIGDGEYYGGRKDLFTFHVGKLRPQMMRILVNMENDGMVLMDDRNDQWKWNPDYDLPSKPQVAH